MNSLINLSLTRLSYDGLLKLARVIYNGFIALVLVYPMPNPLMVAFLADINALSAAIDAWGPEDNRGSRLQHKQLIAAANVVRLDLRMLAAYAVNTMPNNPNSWMALGFSIKSAPKPPVHLQMVRDFRNFVSRELLGGTIKLSWKRPLATVPGDVRGYIIQCANAPGQPPINGHAVINNGIIAIITDTSLILEPPFTGLNYFWITPFNAAGYGVSSDVLMYNAPGKA